jgi:uncharacterized delta-60 repeat protein
MSITKLSRIRFSNGEKLILAILFGLLFSVQIQAQPGRIDLNLKNVLADGADVRAIDTQPDGKILIAGNFTVRGEDMRREAARLNADGSLDAAFNRVTTGGSVLFVRSVADGKVLISGNFFSVNGVQRPHVARLNADGSLDTTFVISGFNVNFIYDMDLQTDGKILLAGVNIIGTRFVTRFSINGAYEGDDFTIAGCCTHTVTFVPGENKILIGGNVNNLTHRGLLRINTNFTIDSTFNPIVTPLSTSSAVKAVPRADGKIMIYGGFDTVNGAARVKLALLNNDGTLDATFNPPTGYSEIINSLVVQPNNKIIIGGIFNTTNTVLRNNIARLNADGSVDATFNQGRGARGEVKALKIRSSGKLLVGGTFFKYHTFPRNGLAQVIF